MRLMDVSGELGLLKAMDKQDLWEHIPCLGKLIGVNLNVEEDSSTGEVILTFRDPSTAEKIKQRKLISIPSYAMLRSMETEVIWHLNEVKIRVMFEYDPENNQHAYVDLQDFDEVFPIIKPKEDLAGHRILNHTPKTSYQKSLLKDILIGIEKLSDFRAPRILPTEENGKIVFKPDNRHPVGHSRVWWDETWKAFMPDKNSRSGTNLHWAVCLGMQIKELVEKMGYSVEDAWELVCDHGHEQGNCWNRIRKIMVNWEDSKTMVYTYGYQAGWPYFGGSDFLYDPNCNTDLCIGWPVLDV